MIRYSLPDRWIKYDPLAIAQEFADAKATLLSLRSIPYQWDWIETLNRMELKREVAGTSRIEGADFTEKELEDALSANQETLDQLVTRSQKQAYAAKSTYRWIARLPDDRPVNAELIKEIHSRIIRGADENHCPGGALRSGDDNVHFGQPRHRGATAGDECAKAFEMYTDAIQSEFKSHDPIIQALSAHYHLAAIHPFLDGNGRTARAVEALLLQRAGLRETCFIAMSNYYYDEKLNYLKALAFVRSNNHDLTPFLKFALKGITIQGGQLLKILQHELKKTVFRNLMFDLFNRLKNKRRRVTTLRQISLLQMLLEVETMSLADLYHKSSHEYKGLEKPTEAFFRAFNGLVELGTLKVSIVDDEKSMHPQAWVEVNLNWPAEISRTDFFEKAKKMPKAKTYPIFR